MSGLGLSDYDIAYQIYHRGAFNIVNDLHLYFQDFPLFSGAHRLEQTLNDDINNCCPDNLSDCTNAVIESCFSMDSYWLLRGAILFHNTYNLATPPWENPAWTNDRDGPGTPDYQFMSWKEICIDGQGSPKCVSPTPTPNPPPPPVCDTPPTITPTPIVTSTPTLTPTPTPGPHYYMIELPGEVSFYLPSGGVQVKESIDIDFPKYGNDELRGINYWLGGPIQNNVELYPSSDGSSTSLFTYTNIDLYPHDFICWDGQPTGNDMTGACGQSISMPSLNPNDNVFYDSNCASECPGTTRRMTHMMTGNNAEDMELTIYGIHAIYYGSNEPAECIENLGSLKLASSEIVPCTVPPDSATCQEACDTDYPGENRVAYCGQQGVNYPTAPAGNAWCGSLTYCYCKPPAQLTCQQACDRDYPGYNYLCDLDNINPNYERVLDGDQWCLSNEMVPECYCKPPTASPTSIPPTSTPTPTYYLTPTPTPNVLLMPNGEFLGYNNECTYGYDRPDMLAGCVIDHFPKQNPNNEHIRIREAGGHLSTTSPPFSEPFVELRGGVSGTFIINDKGADKARTGEPVKSGGRVYFFTRYYRTGSDTNGEGASIKPLVYVEMKDDYPRWVPLKGVSYSGDTIHHSWVPGSAWFSHEARVPIDLPTPHKKLYVAFEIDTDAGPGEEIGIDGLSYDASAEVGPTPTSTPTPTATPTSSLPPRPPTATPSPFGTPPPPSPSPTPTPGVTYTVIAQPVCGNGGTPTSKTKLFWSVWPPSPVTWHYDSSSLGNHTHTETIISSTISNLYIGLLTPAGWSEALQPIGTPPHPKISYGQMFVPASWMAALRNQEVPSGTYQIDYLMPSQYCSTPMLPPAPEDFTYNGGVNLSWSYNYPDLVDGGDDDIEGFRIYRTPHTLAATVSKLGPYSWNLSPCTDGIHYIVAYYWDEIVGDYVETDAAAVSWGISCPYANYAFNSQWGSTGSGDGQFDLPTYMGSDTSGNIYVVDYYNYRMQKFNPNGTFISTWGWGVDDGTKVFQVCTPSSLPCQAGTQGSGDGQFEDPYDIAADSNSYSYVTNYSSNPPLIQKFNPFDNYMLQWGDQNPPLSWPKGITVDSNNNVYVVDEENYRIVKSNSNGTFDTMWGWGVNDGTNEFQICTTSCQSGISGSGDGQFRYTARGITVDSNNNVYVADPSSSTPRIQKFDTNGNYLLQWGNLGMGEGQFDSPSDLATDSDNNVYVVDTSNHRIQKFDPDGNFITMWGWNVDSAGGTGFESCTTGCRAGLRGGGNGQFSYPQGIAIDNNDNIFISDDNNRIQKFTPSALITPTTSPMPTPAPQIILNSGSGQSCTQLCTSTLGLACTDVGTDVDATNNDMWTSIQPGYCKTFNELEMSADCTSITGSSGELCNSHDTDWTYCKCQ
jgi:hypothetical protein